MKGIKAGTPLLKLVQTAAAKKPVIDFFAKWNVSVKSFVYPKNEGWRIVNP